MVSSFLILSLSELGSFISTGMVFAVELFVLFSSTFGVESFFALMDSSFLILSFSELGSFISSELVFFVLSEISLLTSKFSSIKKIIYDYIINKKKQFLEIQII